MGIEDMLTLIGHHDFHILGRVIVTSELSAKLQALKLGNPGAIMTADANWLRSRTRQIGVAVNALLPDKTTPIPDSRRTRAVRKILQLEAYDSLLA